MTGCLGKEGKCWSSYRSFPPPSATGGHGPNGPLNRCAIDKTHLLVPFIGLRLGVFVEIFGVRVEVDPCHGDVFFFFFGKSRGFFDLFLGEGLCPWFLLG